MSITVIQKQIKHSSLKALSVKALIAAAIQYIVLVYYRWYPMYIVEIVSIVLLIMAGVLFILSIVYQIWRTRDMTVAHAKRYLTAFAEQYTYTNDANITELVTAICVLKKHGVLKVQTGDSKKTGTITIDDVISDVNYNVETVATKVNTEVAEIVVKDAGVDTQSNMAEIETVKQNTTVNKTPPRRKVVRK